MWKLGWMGKGYSTEILLRYPLQRTQNLAQQTQIASRCHASSLHCNELARSMHCIELAVLALLTHASRETTHT